MIDSMNSNQSTSDTFSSSLDDLTSFSSISSEPTSFEPISSIQSTISSCNEYLYGEDKRNFNSSDSEIVSSSPSLINRKLRQKLAMLSFNSNLYDEKSESNDTIGPDMSDISDISDFSDGDSSVVSNEDKDKEVFTHASVYGTGQNIDETGMNKYLRDFDHSENDDNLSSIQSTLTSDQIIDALDCSVSVDPSSIKQFRDMIERQKNYLDCLQRELNRLMRMEKVLSKLHQKSKIQQKMLKNITLCDSCEGFCDFTCQTSSNPEIKSDADLKSDSNRYNAHSSNSNYENNLEDKYSTNNYGKLKSDATTQTNRSKFESFSKIGASSKTKKHTIDRTGRVDQMDCKAQAVADEHKNFSLSSENQTMDNNGQSQKFNKEPTQTQFNSRAMNKSASNCNFDSSKKKSVAWTIPVSEQDSSRSNQTSRFNNRLSKHQIEGLDSKNSDISLQQAFRERCGYVLEKSISRVRRINIKSSMRKETADCRLEKQLEEFIRDRMARDNDIIDVCASNKVKVIKPRKIFTEKEMKKQTERLYSHLPEIKKLKEEKMKEQNGKTNRLMAKIFSQRLKNNAVHGKITFPLTQRLTAN